jgi:hypothetical protein
MNRTKTAQFLGAFFSRSRSILANASYLRSRFNPNQWALIISGLALLVSARSCQVANESFNLSLSDFRQERKLILKASFATGKPGEIEDIKVMPVDSSMIFLGGRAYFPSTIEKKAVEIRQSGKFIGVNSLDFSIKASIDTALRRKGLYKQPGKAAASFGGMIPVVIDSTYAAKNERFFDRSLYALQIDWVSSDVHYEDPRVYYEGLVFIKRMPSGKRITRDMIDNWGAKGIATNDLSP